MRTSGKGSGAYGLPTKIGVAIVQKESSFNINAVNKNTGGKRSSFDFDTF